ncbi:MAG: hypothetical protein AAF512_05190 [Pseudomonadota bacterium]
MSQEDNQLKAGALFPTEERTIISRIVSYMSIFIMLLLFSQTGFARENACDSQGEDDTYLELINELDITKLCRLSSEYIAAFRFISVPSQHKYISFTLYQNHDGEVNLYENKTFKRQLTLSEYREVLMLVGALRFFDLKSYEELLEYCEAKIWDKCPSGSDDEVWYLELMYDRHKRVVKRAGEDPSTEPTFTALVEKLQALGQAGITSDVD